jgi:NAD(P)H-hydrate epimerase
MIRALLPVRRPDTHKGTYGRVLIIAGSVGFTGAAALATLGALRAGSGLVVVGVPQSVYAIVASKVTEGMPTPLPDANGALASDAVGKIEELAEGADVIAVGPGLSRASGVLTVVEALLAGSRPLVIDADGLNVLASRRGALERTHAMVVLTPHPGELSRLTGISAAEVQRDRLQAARSAAARFKSIVTLKGARTVVATPEGEAFIVPTGNPGMATGGMGDVLTGVTASFIGQGLHPTQAAYAGAYIHGLAADLIAHARGMVGMLASEVADHLPLAIQRVQAGAPVDGVRELRD